DEDTLRLQGSRVVPARARRRLAPRRSRLDVRGAGAGRAGDPRPDLLLQRAGRSRGGRPAGGTARYPVVPLMLPVSLVSAISCPAEYAAACDATDDMHALRR